MSIINSMKNTITGLRAKLWGPPIPVNKNAASGKTETLRFLYISKPITDDVRQATELGLHDVAQALLDRSKGTTYRSPHGIIKRQADNLASELKLPNKLRRRIRSNMRRQLAKRAAAGAA